MSDFRTVTRSPTSRARLGWVLVVVLVGACASASAPRPGSSRRACTADPAALAVSSPSDVLLGQPAPSLLRALSFEYRWVVLEQVFEDTDENSRLEIEVVHHGLPIGDRRDLRLFTRDDTKGRPIDGFIAESPSGRRIAIDVDGVARVVDTNDGREWEIGPLAEPPAWMHAQGPLYRHYYDGFRVEVRFVDEQRVAFWSRERGLELLDVENGKRTLLAPAPGWLKGLWASPDWVLASLSSRPPRDPAEDERVYRALRRERAANPAPTPPCDPLLNDVGTSRDGGGWLAVHLRSGTVSKPGPGRLWPAPWGLVRLDTQCELSMIVANEETPIASACHEALFVVPGLVEPTVTYECNRGGIRRVGPEQPDAPVPVRVLNGHDLATVDSVAAFVPDDAMWGFRPDGTTSNVSAGVTAPLGQHVIVTADGETVPLGQYVIVTADGGEVRVVGDPPWLAVDWDRRAALGWGPVFVRTLTTPSHAWHRGSPVSPWQAISLPVKDRGCVDPRKTPPEAWGRCISDDSRPLRLDSSGWALVFRGGDDACSGVGPVQPAWTRLFARSDEALRER